MDPAMIQALIAENSLLQQRVAQLQAQRDEAAEIGEEVGQLLRIERAKHEATKLHLQRERERADALARELESMTMPQP